METNTSRLTSNAGRTLLRFRENLSKLERLMAGDLRWVRIESVAPVTDESDEPCVYDLSVEDNENFTLENSVIVHNSGKSMFLEGLSTLPGAVMRFGDAVTKAGIRRVMMDEHPGILVIDEIDKADPKESTALLEVMERQKASTMNWNVNRQEEAKVKVFAAANYVERMLPELVSRFHVIKMRPYTVDEFRAVALRYLLKRGTSEPIARMIADGLAMKTRDIRDARRCADLASSDPRRDVARLPGREGPGCLRSAEGVDTPPRTMCRTSMPKESSVGHLTVGPVPPAGLRTRLARRTTPVTV